MLALLAAATAPATAAAAGPSPYRHSLLQVDGALRAAIEEAPVAVGEGLLSSEVVCNLAEAAEGRGSTEEAAADWSTLGQLVERVDAPALARLDRTLVRADTLLASLGRTFTKAWKGSAADVRRLRFGVSRARAGVKGLRRAHGRIAESLPAWAERRCETAVTAVEAGLGRVPGAVEQVNVGMGWLWALAERKGG